MKNNLDNENLRSEDYVLLLVWLRLNLGEVRDEVYEACGEHRIIDSLLKYYATDSVDIHRQLTWAFINFSMAKSPDYIDHIFKSKETLKYLNHMLYSEDCVL